MKLLKYFVPLSIILDSSMIAMNVSCQSQDLTNHEPLITNDIQLIRTEPSNKTDCYSNPN